MNRRLVMAISPDKKMIQIVEQTYRGGKFSLRKRFPAHFKYKGFFLASYASPGTSQIPDTLYVRGNRANEDDAILSVPSAEWLKKCIAAVKAYNKEYSKKEKVKIPKGWTVVE